MEFLLADHSCVWRVRGCGSGCGGVVHLWRVLVVAVLQPHCDHCALMFGMRLRLSLECWALQHRARHTAARTVPPEDGGWREAGKWAVAQSAGSPPPASHLHHLQPSPAATPCPAPCRPLQPGGGAGGQGRGRGRWPCAGSAAASSPAPVPRPWARPGRRLPRPAPWRWLAAAAGQQPAAMNIHEAVPAELTSAGRAAGLGPGPASHQHHHHHLYCVAECNAICKVWSSNMK